ALPIQLPSEAVSPVLEPAGLEVRIEIPPVAPLPPRRSFLEWVAPFMEQRNILWGELLAGLLIVGCSIALVISLWSSLDKIPYFPFLVFGAITTALFERASTPCTTGS